MSIFDATTGQSFTTVSDAINQSNAGDVIELSAGSYSEQFPTITHDLTIEGVGGLASLTVPGGSPANGEAILATAANVTLDHLELSGAAVGDGNGAGVRQVSGNLTVSNSWLHDNQNGLLTSGYLPGATLTIVDSELSDNGTGDGYTHNLYVGQIGTLTVTGSYFHGVDAGHEIKSRADTTIITDNRVEDGPDSTASYSVDLPNGGNALISGNTIEKGPNAQNYTFVHFTGEGTPDASSPLTITDNTVINDSPDDGGQPIVVLQQYAVTDATGAMIYPDITQNVFYYIPPEDVLVTTFDGGTSPDYSTTNQFLTAGAPALDDSHPFEVAVPEPSSATLLLLSVALSAAIRLRRVRRSPSP